MFNIKQLLRHSKVEVCGALVTLVVTAALSGITRSAFGADDAESAAFREKLRSQLQSGSKGYPEKESGAVRAKAARLAVEEDRKDSEIRKSKTAEAAKSERELRKQLAAKITAKTTGSASQATPATKAGTNAAAQPVPSSARTPSRGTPRQVEAIDGSKIPQEIEFPGKP